MGVSKQGDGYIRRLIVVGATAVVRMVRKNPNRQPWLAALLERKPVRVATVGLANKTAQIAWAVRKSTPLRPHSKPPTTGERMVKEG